MNTEKERIMIMMTEEEYDISKLIGSISSEEDYDMVANLLYFELDQLAVCRFFRKSNEFLLNKKEELFSFTFPIPDSEPVVKNYRAFQRTFNLIKFKMNEILRKRLGTKEDNFTVSITDIFGTTHTYYIDLSEMTISHSNSTGNYILNYEEDTMWIEYLLTKDPDIHLDFGMSSPHIIKVSRVITPIQTFVLRKI